MKKSLIALAALSAFATAAQAQSSVTVYGTVDVGYGESKYTNSATNTVRKTTNTGNGDGGLSTSILGFRGTEDLGGGMKANFTLEWDLTDLGTSGRGAATSSTAQGTAQGFGARQTWVGLEDAKLGQLRLGRQMTASHGVVAGFSAGMANNTAGAIYSIGAPDVGNELGMRPHAVFADRLVTYISPVMSGLQATLQYGNLKHTTTSTYKNTFTDASLRYTSGKLALGAAYQDTDTTANAFTNVATSTTGLGGSIQGAAGFNSGTDAAIASAQGINDGAATGAGKIGYTLTSLGASYDFGMVQPFVLHTDRKTKFATGLGSAANSDMSGSFKTTATEVGARVPVGKNVMAFASMYDGENKSEVKDKMSGYQIGALYSLSKRTTAYAITGQQKYKAAADGSDAASTAKVTGTSVGVRHTF